MQSSFVLSWNCQFHVQVKFTPVEDGLLNWTLLTSNHWHPSQSHGDGNGEACEAKVHIDKISSDRWISLGFGVGRGMSASWPEWNIFWYILFVMWEVRDTSPETTNMVNWHTLNYASWSFLMNWCLHAMITILVGNLLSVFSICILQLGWNQKLLMQADWTHLRGLRECHCSVCFFAFSTLPHTN